MHRTRARALFLSPLLLLLLTASEQAYAQRTFVYTNDGLQPTNTVTGFAVADNGVLTLLPGSPFPTGGDGDNIYLSARNIVVSPIGGFLFVANSAGGNSVSVLKVNPDTGALTRVPGSPFASGLSTPSGLGLTPTPDGRFLVVTGVNASALTVMSVAANGSLKPVPGSTINLESPAGGSTFLSDGTFFAVALQGGGVATYGIGADGMLSPVAGSPFATSGLGFPVGVEVNCAGDLLFVAEGTENGHMPNVVIDVYRVTPEGALVSSATSSPYTEQIEGEGASFNLLLSPDNRYLYLANSSRDTVTGLSVGAEGELTEIEGSPFATGTGFANGSPSSLDVSADGRFLLAPNRSGSVSVFRIGAHGVLSVVSSVPFEPGHGSAALWSAAYPSKACRASDLSIACGPDIVMRSQTLSGSLAGAGVEYSTPQVEGGCFTQTVTCSPESGSFFPAGVTTVTCTATDACGNSASCGFTVDVESPFVGAASVCVVDDASGDSFSEVVDPASPFYGFWTYTVAATNVPISGTASSVRYVAGQSLESRDADYSDENVLYSMKASVKFTKGTAHVTLKERHTPAKLVLRDRDLSDDPPCT